MKLAIGLALFLAAMIFFAGCSDEKNVNNANQEALNNPEVVGTNANGRILYRVYLHTVTEAGGEYFYYWDK